MKIKRSTPSPLMVIAGRTGLLVFGVNFLKGLDLFQKRNVYHAVYTRHLGHHRCQSGATTTGTRWGR
jgi:hypothetical protein